MTTATNRPSRTPTLLTKGLGGLALGALCAMPAGAAARAPEAAPSAAPAETSPEEAKRAEARALYREGSSLFQLGKYEEALEKFEACYKLSPLPLILYNIALTQRELGERDRDPQRLREATSMYRNFHRAMQRDPSLIDESRNITPTAITEDMAVVDKLIEEIEAEETARAEEEAERQAKIAAAGSKRQPEGPDPGDPHRKKGKLWLAAGAGAGGVVAATGLALVAVYGVQASAASADAQSNETSQQNFLCDNPPASFLQECIDLVNEADEINRRGTAAQRNALLIGVPIAVVGAAVVATGVALGVIKKKKGDEETRAWREGAQLFVAPTFGGLTLQGRF